MSYYHVSILKIETKNRHSLHNPPLRKKTRLALKTNFVLFLEELKNLSPPELKKKEKRARWQKFPENEKKYKRNKEKNKKKSTKYPSEDYLSRCQHRRYNLRAFQKKSARAFVLFAKARPQDHNLTEDKKKQKKHGRE